MRLFYSTLFYVAVPFIFLRLLWRSRKAPLYRKRWLERLAIYNQSYPKQVVWFHSVSVGETEALLPLIKKLQQQQPDIKLLITTTTPTGSSRVHAAFQSSVSHVYLPYDVPDVIHRFLKTFKPQLAVFMETEIWPNLYYYCQQDHIPLYVINARLSEKSKRGYQFLSALMKPALASVHILSQSEQDSQRFLEAGAKPDLVTTLGNMKFDLEIPEGLIQQGIDLKQRYFQGCFTWLVASTHQGEEELLLQCYVELKNVIPELLLIIAPRHPERFAAINSLCRRKQLAVVSRTSQQQPSLATDVYLLDTLGELKLFYSAADIAFIGGSLVPVGGHNVLEAVAVGTPVIFGPYMANFKDIANNMLAIQGAVQCYTIAEVKNHVLKLYQEPHYRQSLAGNALKFMEANKGVIEKIAGVLLTRLKALPESPSH